MNILFIGIYDNNELNTAFRQSFKNIATTYKEIATGSQKPTNLNLKIHQMVHSWNPDLIFMQLQAPNVITDHTLNRLKRTGAFLVQWTGDARQPLPKHYIEFGGKINLSLFTNQNDVDIMTEAGCKADFLQVSFDHNIYKPGPKEPGPDIVFMGNNYNNTFALSQYRMLMVRYLRHNYGSRFALYGSNWPKEWGIKSRMYKQEEEAQAYRNAKIGINLSHYDLRKYSSDRMFRIMGCGTLCLSKEFPEMDEYQDKFVTFGQDFKDMKAKIDYYLHNEPERNRIAHNGCEYVHNNCTWDHRANELLTIIERWKT